MESGNPSNITLLAIKASNGVIGPYSNIVCDQVERLNEVSSMIRENSVLVCDQVYRHLGFLLSGSRVIIHSDSFECYEPNIKIVNDIEAVLNKLRRKYDHCYVLGGKKTFKEFSPYASRVFLSETKRSFTPTNDDFILLPEDWEIAMDYRTGIPLNRFKYFQEFYRIKN